jgi:hypothetical protein
MSDLREKVARAIAETQYFLDVTAAQKAADAAISIVVEACAEACKKHEVSQEDYPVKWKDVCRYFEDRVRKIGEPQK